MRKKKSKRRNHLHAIVLIVLVMAVASACKSDYYYYTRYYKVEKVFMTRIQINDFPVKNVELYLTESAFSDCPPETIKHDGKCHAIRPYAGGSIDKAEKVILTNKGKEVYTVPLRHKEFNDTLDVLMHLSEDNTKKIYEYVRFNNTLTLSESITGGGGELYQCKQDTSLTSFCYLLCFDKKKTLPESGIVKFKDREIKIEIDNNTKKFHLIGPIWQPHY